MKHFLQNIWKEWKGELFTTALFVPLFWYLMDSGYLNDSGVISSAALGILAVLALVAAILLLRRKMTWERAATLLLLAGLILRISYTLGTHSYVRHHDYGDVNWFLYGYDEDNRQVYYYGHMPYVLYVYLNRHLADFNAGQFYHPPLFHLLAAGAMWVTYKLLEIEDLVYLFEASKIISCLASCYTLLLAPKICRELKIRGKGQFLSIGVMAFLPMFYLMASWVNNDGLVLYFMAWILLYTLRWYKNPGWINTLMLALGFGLGMMSKMSCALLAFFTGAVMLVKLADAIRKSRHLPGLAEATQISIKALFLRFAGFAAVAFPLGLAYPIRNLILFDQPFNYVLELSIPPVPVTDFVQRFLVFPITRLFSPVFLEEREYNLNLFLVKSASFGEFSYDPVLEPWGIAIVAANLLLILLALMSVVMVGKRCKSLFWRFAFPGLWLLLYLSEAFFAWDYPYPCTMDARYVALTVLLGALYLGKAAEDHKKGFSGLEMAALTVLAVAGGYFFLHS